MKCKIIFNDKTAIYFYEYSFINDEKISNIDDIDTFISWLINENKVFKVETKKHIRYVNPANILYIQVAKVNENIY